MRRFLPLLLLLCACAKTEPAAPRFAAAVAAAVGATPSVVEVKEGKERLPGKVVPVWVQRALVPDEVLGALPDERRPAADGEAKAVARIDCRSEAMGAYSDGVPAYRSVCGVEVRELPGLGVTARRQFAGKVPPRVQEEGRFISTTPPDYAAIADWLKSLPIK
ncbi:MAG: hypothetical protein SF051_00225, partial [Elusimicrobiota bacterium]|nr:hypothetical protein [Elusimicrobiota bacterium]